VDTSNSDKEPVSQVVAVLEDMHVPYMIGGSVALSVWAIPRMTHDLDLVVDLPDHLVADFCSRFSDEGYHIDPEAMRETFRLSSHAGMGMYSFIDIKAGLKVDLFPLRADDHFQQIALSRCVLQEVVAGVKAYVCTPEDLLVQKLRWYVLSESERQFRDCMNLMLSDLKRPIPLISLDYVENWAIQLGPEVQAAWEQVKAAVHRTLPPPAY
jgi:hypothetical protein